MRTVCRLPVLPIVPGLSFGTKDTEGFQLPGLDHFPLWGLWSRLSRGKADGSSGHHHSPLPMDQGLKQKKKANAVVFS